MLHSTVNNGEGGGWDDVFLVIEMTGEVMWYQCLHWLILMT